MRKADPVVPAQLLRLRRLEQQQLLRRRRRPPSTETVNGDGDDYVDSSSGEPRGGIIATKTKSVSSLDEEIKRLEAEVNTSSTSDGDSDSEHSSGNVSSEGGGTHASKQKQTQLRKGRAIEVITDGILKEVLDADGNVVILKSAIDDDRIAPLPKHLLPLPICKIGAGGSANPAAVGAAKRKQDAAAVGGACRKRVMFAEPEGNQGSRNQGAPSRSGSGLAATVQELIKSYVPSSIEKRPLWCRCCQFQAQTETEFNAHRESERHCQNVALERRASTCKLCRKQFTSPEQLKEHVKGRAHKERLESARARQSAQGENPRKFERI